MITFVTAFYTSPKLKFRSPAKYFRLFEKLASSGISILLFLDKKFEDKCENIKSSYPNVKIELTTLDQSWIPIEESKFVFPSSINKEKDTIDYFYVQLSKLRCLSIASTLVETSHLAWIDFGIFHMFNNVEMAKYVLQRINNTNFPLDTVFSPGCWDPCDYKYNHDEIEWSHCGSFMIGDKKMFPKLCEKQTELVLQYLPTITWEVNYWALIDGFTYYKADHDISMLTNLLTYLNDKNVNKMCTGKHILEDAVADHPDSECARALLENFYHFEEIHRILEGGWQYGWGSYLFNGQEYTYQRETLKKQEALFNVGKTCFNVLEVGVYLGHSLLILLISNPNLRITCVDNDDRFSPKVVNYLNKMFNNRITFFLGDAVKTVEKLQYVEFDCIHIDADHYEAAVNAQFNVCVKYAKPNAFIVFDDYEAVQPLIDGWISNGTLTCVTIPWCLWTNIVTRLA